jgi:hypothetical protein
MESFSFKLTYSSVIIVAEVTKARLRWLGQVERMPEDRVIKKLYMSKPEESRSVGRPKMRWLDDVEEDLRKMRISGWRGKARKRDERTSVLREVNQGSSRIVRQLWKGFTYLHNYILISVIQYHQINIPSQATLHPCKTSSRENEWQAHCLSENCTLQRREMVNILVAGRDVCRGKVCCRHSRCAK